MKGWISDLYYLGILLIVVTLPFAIIAKNIAILFTTMCWLILLNDRDVRVDLLHAFTSNKAALFMLAFVLMYIISVFIHFGEYDDIMAMLKTIEKRTHFLVFPIILSGVAWLPNYRIRKLFKLYIIIILITSIFLLITALVITIESGTTRYISPVDNTIQHNFQYHRLASYIGMHAVYFSAYVLIAFSILFIQLLFKRNAMIQKRKNVHIAALSFLGIMIVILNSAMISIIFMLVVIVILVYYWHYKKVRLRISRAPLLLIAIVVIAVSIGVFNKLEIKSLNLKKNLLEYNLSDYPDIPGSPEQNWNALNLRLAIWEVSGYALKDHWLLGVGPHNLKPTLGDYYEKYDFKFGMINNLNPHNQFIHTFLVLGIAGLIILIALFIVLIKMAIQRKDILFLSMLILLILFSITESTLVTNKGIVFFSFFLILFSYLKVNSLSYLTGNNSIEPGK